MTVVTCHMQRGRKNNCDNEVPVKVGCRRYTNTRNNYCKAKMNCKRGCKIDEEQVI